MPENTHSVIRELCAVLRKYQARYRETRHAMVDWHQADDALKRARALLGDDPGQKHLGLDENL
jgi:hypothetical protein